MLRKLIERLVIVRLLHPALNQNHCYHDHIKRFHDKYSDYGWFEGKRAVENPAVRCFLMQMVDAVRSHRPK
jgi:hypothetical protein